VLYKTLNEHEEMWHSIADMREMGSTTTHMGLAPLTQHNNKTGTLRNEADREQEHVHITCAKVLGAGNEPVNEDKGMA